MLNRRLALAASALLAALSLAACNKGVSPVTGDDMSLGNPNAKVTVIEYASVACPHCGRWNAEVWPAFKAKYVDSGKINYVFREYVIQPQIDNTGFLTARCAGKEKYFSVIDAFFHIQSEVAATRDFRTPALRIAQSTGMSPQQFEACVTNVESIESLKKRAEDHIADGVTSTPTFFINGKKLEGEQPLTALDAAIAEAETAK